MPMDFSVPPGDPGDPRDQPRKRNNHEGKQDENNTERKNEKGDKMANHKEKEHDTSMYTNDNDDDEDRIQFVYETRNIPFVYNNEEESQPTDAHISTDMCDYDEEDTQEDADMENDHDEKHIEDKS